MAHFPPSLISLGETSSRSHCQDSIPVALFTKAQKVPVLAELRFPPLPHPSCDASLGQEIKIRARRREDTRRGAITSIGATDRWYESATSNELPSLWHSGRKKRKSESFIASRITGNACHSSLRVKQNLQQTASSLASLEERSTICNEMWYKNQETGVSDQRCWWQKRWEGYRLLLQHALFTSEEKRLDTCTCESAQNWRSPAGSD